MKKNIYTVLCITLCQFYFSCNLNVEPLIMGYWNVENLFDLVDDPEKNDDEFSIGGRKNVTEDIYKLKLTHTAEVLDDLNYPTHAYCNVFGHSKHYLDHLFFQTTDDFHP